MSSLPLTTATMRSTTSPPPAAGVCALVTVANVKMTIASSSLFMFKPSDFITPTSTPLERLAEAEVYLVVLQAVDGGAAAELRDEELGRVEQVGPVRADGAERRLEPQAEAHGVRPLLARVRVAPRLAAAGVEEVARAVEDVAAVVEGHGLYVARQRHARFEVDDGHRVSADGDCERVDRDDLALLVSERPARPEEGGRRVRARDGAGLRPERAEGRDDARPRLLEAEAAQGGRAAREEALADGEAAVGVVDEAVPVAVARVEEGRDAELQARREHRVPQAVQRVVALVAQVQLVEGEGAAERRRRQRVIHN